MTAAANYSPDEFDDTDEVERLRAQLTELTQRAAQLEQAIGTRDIIATAKGLLMASEKVDRDEAFEVLRRASQRENLRVREIAERLVATHEERLTKD
jgi:AmiR/NasT family two-component response regulator